MEFSLPMALTQLFWIVLKASGPILGVAAIAGLVIAVFQGATQIQDQTLPQVAKIVAVMMLIIVFGAALFTPLGRFAQYCFELIPAIGR